MRIQRFNLYLKLKRARGPCGHLDGQNPTAVGPTSIFLVHDAGIIARYTCRHGASAGSIATAAQAGSPRRRSLLSTYWSDNVASDSVMRLRHVPLNRLRANINWLRHVPFHRLRANINRLRHVLFIACARTSTGHQLVNENPPACNSYHMNTN